MTIIIRGFTLLLVLFLIWLLNDSFEDRQVKQLQATDILGTKETPDYYSENLQIREFNDKGELKSLIESKKFSHYSGQLQALLESPKLVVYSIEGDVWKITSSAGEISDANRNLTLIDDVSLSISASDNKQIVTITTSELHYNVAEQSLWTEQKISGKTLGGTFTSNGLHMDLETEQLILKNKVRIHYDL